MKKTHIIILNWNGGEDTWKCVRSVCALPDVRITVLDNASTDDSVAFLREKLEKLGIGHEVLDGATAEALSGITEDVSIVRSDRNLGFAAGVNLVLGPLTRRADLGYVWLLNNDAIATPDTLFPLIDALESDMQLAFAGSVIMDAARPEEVQCFGVRYFKWLGVGKMRFKGRSLDSISNEEIGALRPDFQHGASLLIRMEAVRTLGLMDERYFLYSEEQDWQERAARAGLRNACVPASLVYHLGSMSTARSKHLFYYYYSKSSVIFSRKHHPGITAIVASCMLVLITMVRTRLHPKSMSWAMKGIREAWKTEL